MKKIIFGRWVVLLLACAFLAFDYTASRASESQVAGQRVKNFYRWYLNQLESDKTPMSNRSMVKSYSSRRLWKWLNSKAYREYGADYFLQAQDFSPNWNNNMGVSNTKVQNKVATLTLTLSDPKLRGDGMGRHTLRLRLVKESGAWKIDRASGQ